MAGALDKASTEQLRELVRIDDNIELIRKDVKDYAKQARDEIKSLQAQKRRVRENINQGELFDGGGK